MTKSMFRHSRVDLITCATIWVLLLLALAGLSQTVAGRADAAAMPIPAEARLLAPHRAVYDVQLDDSTTGDAVSAVTGRLVFELTGNACEGFTQNLRFVMTITNREGVDTVSDLRTSTWEAADGSRYRFSNSAFDNQRPGDQTVGDAERTAAGVVVHLDKPSKQTVTLGANVMFPMQQTIALLAAARAGKPFVSTDIYDGSEKGDKAIFTNAVIGKPLGAAATSAVLAAGTKPDQLQGKPQWPVTIAYFSGSSAQTTGTPQQEMRLTMYENGVVGALTIDYGDLAVRGKLSEISFYPPTNCSN